MKIRKTLALLTSICLLGVLLVGCGALAGTSGSTSSSTNTSANQTSASTTGISDISYDNEDLAWVYNENSATKITLNTDSASVSGSGATAAGSVITINASGCYIVSGTLSDGQIIVNSTASGRVWIILKNANITCQSSAPIYVMKAEKTVITLADESINSLTDGESYKVNADDEPTACIFSKDDLVINGNGTLNISANYDDGITGKDDLRIVSGVINITSKDDGIVGKDLLAVKTAQITINAGGDGMKASNDTDAGKGVLSIEDGNFNITATNDGLQAVSTLQIFGGQFNITTGGGSAVSSTSDDWGNWGGGQAQQDTSSDATDTSSAKGIKATSEMYICGGTFTINSSDDAIHTNGTLQISDGNFNITSGDDGIHADTVIVINNGSFTIAQSYEGIESASITINNGTFDITSSDDGINVAGGNDSSALGDRPGQNTFTESSSYMLTINGGNILVNANGDGLDSNGAIEMTNGTVIVDGPINSGNGALDYTSGFNFTGGQLIAAGSIGMAQAISDTSSVYCISLGLSAVQNAGSTITVEDSEGNEIISYTGLKVFQSVVIASEALKKGETYTIYCNGTQVDTATISSVVTSVGTTSGGMGGGQQGGTQQGGTKPGGRG